MTTATKTAPVHKKAPAGRYWEGVGRRKTATARVRLQQGVAGFTVNGKALKDYFTLTIDQLKATVPLEKAALDKFGGTVLVKGGGVHAQAEAIRHGIARALVKMDEKAYRPLMRQMGYLTRDSRMRERKKFGLKRARKAPQWAKR